MLDLITALRRNHAIEHATAAVLLAKMKAGSRIVGRATTSGFYIYGDVSTEAVSQAVESGLARLKQGERNLAISPFCGTNLVTAALLAGLASVLTIKGKRGSNSFPTAVLASLAGIMLAQPLARQAQKHLTTSVDVADVKIDEVTSKDMGRYIRHKIRTLQH